MKNKSSTIIITGGPGMGKTSVLEQLSIMGYHSVEETGRSIIQKELKTDGNRLPWLDKEGFAMAMFQQSLKDFQNVSEKSGLTFFDRGIPDVIGYLKLCNISIPETMWQAAEESDTILRFLLPHLGNQFMLMMPRENRLLKKRLPRII